MLRNCILVLVMLASVVGGILIGNIEPEIDEAGFKNAQSAQFKDLSGNWRKLSDWDGAYRIVNFWATWCPPCLEEIPLFISLHEEFSDINMTFIGIAVDDITRVRDFVMTNKVNYPILIGSGDALRISEILGNQRSGLPFTVFLSPTGDLIDTHSGVVPASKIRDFASKIR
ncbi:TlpA family protein disulfide reductase [Burkholderiales bacterium]|nr:TlpA family protein disulfide reductase [Burkholderiales bacterium]